MRQRNCRMQKLPEFVIMPNFVKSVFQQKNTRRPSLLRKRQAVGVCAGFSRQKTHFSGAMSAGRGFKCPYFFSKWVRLPSKPDLGMGFATFSVLGAL